MNKKFEKFRLLFLFSIYLFFYFFPMLTNPFVPANIIEIIVILSLALLGFLVIYSLIINQNINRQTVSNVQSGIFIFMIILLVFNPFGFAKNYNFYIPRIICIVIILVWLLATMYLAKKFNVNKAVPLIIFVPSLIQAILMSISVTAKIYLAFPYLTAIITIIGIFWYRNYESRK
ncbi:MULTISPECIES: hypothetical protein [unclassified Gemella]|uniref:hypothetical protein n=1 Tax=unclassified Gemella TaxID=2624949 RepID=UPI001C04D722|nr:MULTISPECIES: hypothetical protein [unclassified Gemella]MBU0278428.1 hypothetical protein [Gemella sp. zg-1178]QWQ38960.1 hypothetical protein KMP11_01020 [Gemella sp. zg-570]